jgi:phosphoenolpyruvate phosphomutase
MSSQAAAPAPPKSRARALKEMLLSPQLEFIMEAHSGISAKIVQETGFKGIWASGLSISAQMGGSLMLLVLTS